MDIISMQITENNNIRRKPVCKVQQLSGGTFGKIALLAGNTGKKPVHICVRLRTDLIFPGRVLLRSDRIGYHARVTGIS